MKFTDLPYTRIDLEQVKSDMAELTQRLKDATSFEEAEQVFLAENEMERHLDTMQSIASIRNSIDTTDPTYDLEMKFWHNSAPDIAAMSKEWGCALLASKFKEQIANKYGHVFLLNIELQARTYNDAIRDEIRQEKILTQEYQNLLASAQIAFEGKTYTMAQLSPFKNSLDDAKRLAAWQAEGAWLKGNEDKIEDIYDELVKLRTAMGRKLGHDNYVPMGYDRMVRNCYGKEDIETFRENVVRYIVPLAGRLKHMQAKRMGYGFPMNHSESTLEFKDGNARPVEDVVGAAKVFYDNLSQETSLFFNELCEGEFFDLPSRKGKRSGGYCSFVPDYRMPFIFANLNGTQHDAEVMTHEAGHAFAAWLNRDRIPFAEIWPSLEACECHSMSMEFFSELYAEEFFGADADKYRFSHLAGAITFIPYGTMVDHFQHIVYENPGLSKEERNEEWRKLAAIYQPWLKLDGVIPFYGEGLAWQRQHHIFTLPFYYIDYCLAQTVSLEFWRDIQHDNKRAWQKYMAYAKLGGSETFTNLLAKANIASPFDPVTLKNVAEAAAKYLDKHAPGVSE